MKALKEKWGAVTENIGKYIIFCALVFFAFFVLGIFFVHFYPELAKESFEELGETFSFLFDLTPLQTGVFIFANNSIKVFLFMFLGLLFALPTVFFLAVNGWVLGYVSALAYPELGVWGVFHSLFWHGTFELAALFLGCALGVRLGVLFYKEAKKSKDKKISPFSSLELKKALSLSVNFFFYFILPLIFIAAVIETLLIFFL